MGLCGISYFAELPDQLDLKTCKEALNECFDQNMFDDNAIDGKISKTKILELMHSWTPSHILVASAKATNLDKTVSHSVCLKLKGSGYDVHTMDKASAAMTSVVVNSKNMRTVMESVDKASVVVVMASNSFCNDLECYSLASYASAIGAKIVVIKTHQSFIPVDGWMKKVFSSAAAVVTLTNTDVSEAITVIQGAAGNSAKPKEYQPKALPNGDKFYGNLKDEKKHGWGKCIYANPQGRTYEGQMIADKRDGFGCCVYPNSDVFLGNFVGEKYVGKGIYWYETGDIFEGEYLEGKRHGYGVCKYATGDCYIGDFKHDKYNGIGRYTWVDDAYYEGDYKDDEMHGNGKMVNPDGSVSYDGQWVNGEEV